jgi:hypothetical protein
MSELLNVLISLLVYSWLLLLVSRQCLLGLDGVLFQEFTALSKDYLRRIHCTVCGDCLFRVTALRVKLLEAG